jgi:hypothetical protein
MQKQNCKKKKKRMRIKSHRRKIEGGGNIKKKLQFKKSCKTNKQQSK